MPRAGLAVLVAGVGIGAVTFVLHHRHHGDVAQAQQLATARLKPFPGAEAVPSRTAFSDPSAYAAAMTRLALASGRTEVDGKPACASGSTWDRWTCRAKGRPTLGPYAGSWLTYRCSPSYTPQPGGRPAAAMIGCTPVNPPSLTTARSSRTFPDTTNGTSRKMSVTVTTSPNAVTAGGTFKTTITGTGGKTFTVRLTNPDGSTVEWTAYAGMGSIDLTMDAPQAGEYRVEVFNHRDVDGPLLASATETAA
jgi:hypothetical protein